MAQPNTNPNTNHKVTQTPTLTLERFPPNFGGQSFPELIIKRYINSPSYYSCHWSFPPRPSYGADCSQWPNAPLFCGGKWLASIRHNAYCEPFRRNDYCKSVCK